MKKTIVLGLSVALLAMSGSITYAQIKSVGAKAFANQNASMNLPCVQTAVGVRETAIQASFTKFTSSTLTAMQTRATALNTAWGMTVGAERRAARKAAWDAYKSTNDAARATFKTEKQVAWDTFNKASAVCGVEVVETPSQDGLTI